MNSLLTQMKRSSAPKVPSFSLICGRRRLDGPSMVGSSYAAGPGEADGGRSHLRCCSERNTFDIPCLEELPKENDGDDRCTAFAWEFSIEFDPTWAYGFVVRSHDSEYTLFEVELSL
mmetsp:Transcript_24162/g.81226  ORF Transcript_24162/g.81226 Transcript_24162/m.81226 type:complete len:117 (-) Transcript_24162:337-687(-)